MLIEPIIEWSVVDYARAQYAPFTVVAPVANCAPRDLHPSSPLLYIVVNSDPACTLIPPRTLLPGWISRHASVTDNRYQRGVVCVEIAPTHTWCFTMLFLTLRCRKKLRSLVYCRDNIRPYFPRINPTRSSSSEASSAIAYYSVNVLNYT